MVADLWVNLQDVQSNGTFVSLPDVCAGKIRIWVSTFRAVIIKGQPKYLGADAKNLEPGSYFGSKGEAVHQVSSSEDEETVIYVRTNGKYEVILAK